MTLKPVLLAMTLLFCHVCQAGEPATIRLGILPFGTVNWEITAMQNAGLDTSAGFQLEIHPVATPQAGKIALQSRSVDMIVSDWIWTSQQRSAGHDLSFYPYSNTTGALIVAADSPVHSIAGLPGKSLGIAGGELDKNWLLLRALYQQQFQQELEQSVTEVYAAPPLLNQQLLQQRVEAIMTYWHFAARLEAQGYRQVIDGREIVHALGIKTDVPGIGFVFWRTWAENNKPAINRFFTASKKTKDLLCTSDTAWAEIAPLTKAADHATETLLRQRYCAGRINVWGKEQQAGAEKIYTLLKQLSNNRLTGKSDTIRPGTFWTMH